MVSARPDRVAACCSRWPMMSRWYFRKQNRKAIFCSGLSPGRVARLSSGATPTDALGRTQAW
jgi:hypothetical protein